MPSFEVVANLPRLHVTPLATIKIQDGRVVVEADDEQEHRVRFVCEPYQAARVVTVDCFDVPDGLEVRHGAIVEVCDSAWLEELAVSLGRHDHTATFMQKARHFLFPLQDDFLEVVAWDLRSEPAA